MVIPTGRHQCCLRFREIKSKTGTRAMERAGRRRNIENRYVFRCFVTIGLAGEVWRLPLCNTEGLRPQLEL